MDTLPLVQKDPCAICQKLCRTLVYRQGMFVCGDCAKGRPSPAQLEASRELHREEEERLEQEQIEKDYRDYGWYMDDYK